MSTATAPRAFFRDPASVKRPTRNAKPEPTPLPDAEVAAFRAKLKPENVQKLAALVRQAALAGGYQNAPRENGPLWQRYEREILEHWIRHEVDVDEIEMPEVAS